MGNWPQSVAKTIYFKLFLSSDHVTAATGKTVAVTLSKNHGAFGNPSAGASNATEISNGWYYFTSSTTDYGTAGPVQWRGTAASCDDSEPPGDYVVNANNGGLAALPDNLPFVAGGLAGHTLLNTVAGYIDTEIAAILAAVDTEIADIQSRLPAALGANGNLKADVRDLLGTAWLTPGTAGTPDVNTKTITASAISNSSLNVDTGLKAVSAASGTLTAGSSTTATLPVGASAVDNFYQGLTVVVFGGTGAGESAVIASYAGSTRVATFDRTLGTALDNTSQVRVMPNASALLTRIVGTLASGTHNPQSGDAFAYLGTNVGLLGVNLTAADDAVIAAIAALNNLSSAGAQAAAAAALAAYGAATVANQTTINNNVLLTASQSSVNAIAADLPARITKNTALAAFPFKMVDATDHITAETGVTVTATRSLDGAAFAPCANSAAEISSGWYKIDLAATDTNANTIILRFTGSGCDDTEFTIITEPT